MAGCPTQTRAHSRRQGEQEQQQIEHEDFLSRHSRLEERAVTNVNQLSAGRPRNQSAPHAARRGPFDRTQQQQQQHSGARTHALAVAPLEVVFLSQFVIDFFSLPLPRSFDTSLLVRILRGKNSSSCTRFPARAAPHYRYAAVWPSNALELIFSPISPHALDCGMDDTNDLEGSRTQKKGPKNQKTHNKLTWRLCNP